MRKCTGVQKITAQWNQQRQRYLQTNSLQVRISLNFLNVTDGHTDLRNSQLRIILLLKAV